MSQQDIIKELIGLQDVTVKKVEQNQQEMHVHLELERKEHMCTYFKNATLITDKYHWIRQALWALENVRKRIQKQLGKEKRIYFKHSRKLLLKRFDELSDEHKKQVLVMIDLSPDLSTAYFLKEQLYKYVIDAENQETALKELNIWIEDAKESEIPEFRNVITAYTNWKKSIINSCCQPITNGFTEGCNNKIKVLKRNAYGYRNFDRFRKRILLCLLHSKKQTTASLPLSAHHSPLFWVTPTFDIEPFYFYRFV